MTSDDLIADATALIQQKLNDLGSSGWKLEVIPYSARRPNVALSIEFTHPLTPYTFGYSVAHEHVGSALARIAQWMDDHEEFQVVALASGTVREEMTSLLKSLRGAIVHTTVLRAVESVGWALFENGLLTRQEVDWLAHTFSTEWVAERTSSLGKRGSASPTTES